MKTIEVLFTPVEFTALDKRKLSQWVCVVFDVLRATSTIVTALANGATGVQPVLDIPEALGMRVKNPKLLLAGERNGVRIPAQLTGGIEFDLGNSPREFSAERVLGRELVITTTNGTCALNACRGAKSVLAASFLNLRATARFIRNTSFEHLLLVCSGTGAETALEDVLGAGALCAELCSKAEMDSLSDSAQISRAFFDGARMDLVGAFSRSRNGRRLLSIPELRDDLAFCAQRDLFDFAALLDMDGTLRKHQA